MPQATRGARNSILIGTNTDLLRRLLSSVLREDGSIPNKIHPQLLQACRRVVREKSAPIEGVGCLWKLEARERVLQPGEVARVKATVKLTWDQPGPFVVLETDEKLELLD